MTSSNPQEIYSRCADMGSTGDAASEAIKLTAAGVLDDVENVLDNILNRTLKSPKEAKQAYNRVKEKWLGV